MKSSIDWLVCHFKAVSKVTLVFKTSTEPLGRCGNGSVFQATISKILLPSVLIKQKYGNY